MTHWNSNIKKHKGTQVLYLIFYSFIYCYFTWTGSTVRESSALETKATYIYVWKVYTINCRQSAYQVNAVQCVDRYRKKHTLCLSVSTLPSINLKGLKFLTPVKVRKRKAGGTQATGLSCYCHMWPPVPHIWKPGLVRAASHQGKGRVPKYLVGMLKPKRELCVCVCGMQGLLRGQGERAGLLQSTVQGDNELLLCDATSPVTVDRTSFLSQRPQNPSPELSALRASKQRGGICCLSTWSFLLPSQSPWAAVQVTSVHQDSNEHSEIQQSSVENFLILRCF